MAIKTLPCKTYRSPPKGFSPKVHVTGGFLSYQGKFLLLERAENKPQGGTWGIPAGKQEKSETPLETLHREIKEEVGISLQLERIVEVGTLYVEHPDLHFCFHMFYIPLKNKPKVLLEKSEHCRFEWIPYDEEIPFQLIGGGQDAIDFCFQISKALSIAFQKNLNEEIADWHHRYMREQFPFFGLQKPKRAKIQKDLFLRHPILTESHLEREVRALFKSQERELHYAAIDLLFHYRHLWSKKTLVLVEKLIEEKSWWDTVDTLASKILGTLLIQFRDLIPTVSAWKRDKNLWKRRSSLIFQLQWKEKTDEKLLFQTILSLAAEKEFFIQKAIGWALRQYARTNPKAVTEFVKKNEMSLSPLAKREAIRALV